MHAQNLLTSPEGIVFDNGAERYLVSNADGGEIVVIDAEGNIDEDPQFADSTYTLNHGSPCIDAGDTTFAFSDPEDPTDPGTAQWPAIGGLRNDMGAYGGPQSAQLAAEVTFVDEEGSAVPRARSLSRNYPNPVHDMRAIAYSLGRSGAASLTVHDVSGRRVAILVNEEIPKGQHTAVWQPGDLLGGIYVYRMAVDGEVIGTRQPAVIR